jgi:hypothetical protein
MNAAESKQVAETILAQMGGAGRLAVMCGCKDFLVVGPGVLQFKIGKGARLGGESMGKPVTCCRVALEADDTYTMSFYSGRGMRMKELLSVPQVYADQLRPIFEAQTGMYLSL